ncbi:MAG: phosphoesterase, partial [Leptospiraceae bacterium]|nr:phosphoesterase [Leptospiraceae bacterium]
YIDEHSPMLVVSGHVHEDQGVIKKGNTVFFNPSNFGPVDSVYGYQEGGFFGEIYIEEKKVQKVNLMRLVNQEVIELIKVNTSGEKLSMEYINPNSPVSEEGFVRL